jgi:hypothetical protein
VSQKMTVTARQMADMKENLVELAKPSPTDEAVVDRLGRPVLGRRIAPPQTVPDHDDDAADDLPIINPRHTMRQWKIRFDPAHLHRRQPNQVAYDGTSSRLH